MTLGEYVKNYREQYGISLRDFGKMVDISGQHVSNLEKGLHKPTMELFAKVAKATGKTTLELCALLDDEIIVNAKEKTPSYNESVEDVIDMLVSLPTDKVDQVRDYIEFLLRRS